MKIKTQDLTGAALDWAVAKCEGWDAPIFRNRTWAVPLYVATNGAGLHTYAPSTDLAQGGPIIKREGISTRLNHKQAQLWEAYIWLPAQHDQSEADSNSYTAFGTTALIVAMRAYVASKLGDEVDIPEELS